MRCKVCEVELSDESQDLCIVCEAELLDLEVDCDMTKASKLALMRDIDDAAAAYLDGD
jgi:hypothetical protein